MPTFTEHLPLAALDIVPTGVSGAWGKMTVRIEPRTVKFTDSGTVSAVSNAWCYVRHGAADEHTPVKENYLGPIINVRRGEPLSVAWVNTLHSIPPMMQGEARIQELPPVALYDMMADLGNIDQFKSMNYSIGVVTHLHGGKVKPDSDGWPLLPVSFESNPFRLKTHRLYHYPNDQRAAMLWFHDHGMDNTAPQVYSGLAGLYFIRDESDDDLFQLIGDETQELPLVIQDRLFNSDLTQADYKNGIPLNAAKDGFDRPEFLGDTIMVNGRPWPHTHVHPMVYRLRVLNGSNARTYALALTNPEATSGKVWYGDLLTVIGNDAGLFAQAKTLAETDYVLIAPGQRLDILLDLTSVDPALVNALRLVNLALILPLDDPEPIFQTDATSVTPPPVIYKGSSLYNEPRAQVMEFKLNSPEPRMAMVPLDKAALDQILLRYADDEGFHWDNSAKRLIKAKPAAHIQQNRFILMMNNTSGMSGTSPFTNGPWRDVQIWELTTPTGHSGSPPPFQVAFQSHLNSPALPGIPANAGVKYQVSRAFFFEPEDPKPPYNRRTNDPLWGLATENSAVSGSAVFNYPHLYRHHPSQGRQAIKPRQGTYERWYVANIGNAQPFADSSAIPDMHPFHIHLVNFVVLRRWRLDGTPGAFIEVTGERELDFDGLVRHDTVRIPSNELVELLVYFPEGYTGRYPYHCHLVEHEDMGMMLHFDVQP